VATIRERRPGIWEVRVFTGRDEHGRPTQISKSVRGSKRDAKRLAAIYESRPPSHAGGRAVSDLLNAWIEVNTHVWSEATRRDNLSRADAVAADSIGSINIARLGVSDVERWHARMRVVGVGEAAIRSRHSALRAALSQAVRWEWIGTNVARSARLRQARRSPRDSMDIKDVRAVIAAAASIDPAAHVALRLAAVGGLRRAELAALRWDEVLGDRLTVDSSVETVRGSGGPEYRDSPTKTANTRTIPLDPETVRLLNELRVSREAVSPYVFSLTSDPPSPARIGWWWTQAREKSGIDLRWRLHDMRHWTATAAIATGHDVRAVAGRLGHANPAMTLRVYAHSVEDSSSRLATSLASDLDEANSELSDEGSET
jgi:integrase